MKRITNLFLLSTLLAWGTCSLRADEPQQAIRAAAAPNAAGIYWHAFAAFPSLNDEEKKLLKTGMPSVMAPLSDELALIVARYRRALHELHRARAVVPCDWQLDLSAGAGLILPHVDKALELSRVALLRAHQRLAASETDAALSDVVAVFKLARDCGSSPLVISMYVEASIERSAADFLAMHLTRLNTDQIRQLTVALNELPPSNYLATTILQDQSMSCDWLEGEINKEIARLNDPKAAGQAFLTITAPLNFTGGPGPTVEEVAEETRKADLLKSLSHADIQRSFQQQRSSYAELHKIAGLPFAERAERVKSLVKSPSSASKMETREDAMRYVTKVVMPFDWNDVFAREEQMHVRRQLLEQALRVQLQGADAVQELHGKKVEYRKTAHGFDLSCLVGDKPEVFTVGISK
jgi:hypothetical protein